jgi:Fe-S-cluster containining protein
MEAREIRRIFYRDGYRMAHAYLDQELTPANLSAAVSQLYRAVDELLESFVQRSASEGVAAACKKGCSWCCYQEVFAVTHELIYLHDHLMQNGNPEKEGEILERAREKARLTGGRAEEEQQNVRAACPFLEKGSCMVYEARPMACRIYVSSSVRSCRTNHDHPENGNSFPELFEFPLNAGRMLNEGFVSYLKQRGLRSVEWPLEQGYPALVSQGGTWEAWIRESGASL